MATAYLLRAMATPAELVGVPTWRRVLVHRLDEAEEGEAREGLLPWMRRVLASGNTYGVFTGECGVLDDPDEADMDEVEFETTLREELVLWNGSEELFRETWDPS